MIPFYFSLLVLHFTATGNSNIFTTRVEIVPILRNFTNMNRETDSLAAAFVEFSDSHWKDACAEKVFMRERIKWNISRSTITTTTTTTTIIAPPISLSHTHTTSTLRREFFFFFSYIFLLLLKENRFIFCASYIHKYYLVFFCFSLRHLNRLRFCVCVFFCKREREKI